jgi:hypothetical protein
MSDGPLHWDVTRKRRTRLQRVLGARRTSVAVLLGIAAVAVLVVPLVVFVQRVVARQPAVHQLEAMAKAAQPDAARLIDSGVKGNDGKVGFAFGVSTQLPATLLQATPPAPWAPGPPLPEAPDTRLYHAGKLVLSVKVTPCLRLAQCRPGDALVYTEVQDVS